MNNKKDESKSTEHTYTTKEKCTLIQNNKIIKKCRKDCYNAIQFVIIFFKKNELIVIIFLFSYYHKYSWK